MLSVCSFFKQNFLRILVKQISFLLLSILQYLSRIFSTFELIYCELVWIVWTRSHGFHRCRLPSSFIFSWRLLIKIWDIFQYPVLLPFLACHFWCWSIFLPFCWVLLSILRFAPILRMIRYIQLFRSLIVFSIYWFVEFTFIVLECPILLCWFVCMQL